MFLLQSRFILGMTEFVFPWLFVDGMDLCCFEGCFVVEYYSKRLTGGQGNEAICFLHSLASFRMESNVFFPDFCFL